MSVKFDFSKYSGNYAMHCKTLEEAAKFCRLMIDSGRTWSSGESYLANTNWLAYREDTCYCFNEGAFCNIDYANANGLIVLECSDYLSNSSSLYDSELTSNELSWMQTTGRLLYKAQTEGVKLYDPDIDYPDDDWFIDEIVVDMTSMARLISSKVIGNTMFFTREEAQEYINNKTKPGGDK